MGRPIRVAHVATVDLTVHALLLPQLRELMRLGYDVTAVSATGPSVPAIEAEGVRHLAWRNATRSWDLVADVRAFVELIGILRRERFDIVHTHNAKPGVMGRIGAKVARTPIVVNTVHGFDATPDDPFFKRFVFMGLEWLAARFSDLELYQGEADLERAHRLWIVRGSRGVLLGNGTDISYFAPDAVSRSRRAVLRGELGFRPDEFVVGTVGRLVREKGYLELIAAAEVVRQRNPAVRFLAVGDRDPAKADALTDRDMHEARGFVFTGWRDDVRDLLAAMDVFVLASWREGVPRSAVEAASMGRPMILSDIPGCRQVARDGEHALIVPVLDPRRLADAILRLVDDGELCRRLGDAARERAVASFNEARIVEAVGRGYARLLDSIGERR